MRLTIIVILFIIPNIIALHNLPPFPPPPPPTLATTNNIHTYTTVTDQQTTLTNNITTTPTSQPPELPPDVKHHPSKGKPKRKPSEEEKKHKCSHLQCSHGNYGDSPARYTSADQLHHHERNGAEHPCASGTDCKACAKYREQGTFKEPPVGLIPCRHTKCLAQLKNKSVQIQHEKNHSLHRPELCGENCNGCAEVKKNKQRKRKRDDQKHNCGKLTCQEANAEKREKDRTEVSTAMHKFADSLTTPPTDPKEAAKIQGSVSTDGWLAIHFGNEEQRPVVMSLDRYERLNAPKESATCVCLKG